ncbi:MAG: hypothetical protein IJ088_04110 [Clostridia bacterium]|nr:hypothetical protein [Clostridia bacterium]
MSNNATLEAYEQLLEDVVLFREEYEVFDTDVVHSIETFNSDALRAGASFIQSKVGNGFGTYLSHMRGKIYENTRTLAESLLRRYTKWCDVFGESPKSYSLTFKQYSSPDIKENQPGRIQLRDARQALETCNFVRAHLISSYSVLQQAYARLNNAYRSSQSGVVLQDIPRMDSWMTNIENGIKQVGAPYQVTITTLDVLIKKLDNALKS